MVPRFPTQTEQAYMDAFPDSHIVRYAPACVQADFEKLLQSAIKEQKEVTLQEVKDLAGEEAFKERDTYLKEWGMSDA